jgi:hypothetical protein
MFLLCLRVALVSSGSRREDLFLKKLKRHPTVIVVRQAAEAGRRRWMFVR